MTDTADERPQAQEDAAPQARMRTIFQRFWPDTRPFRGRMLLGLLLVPVSPALTTAGIYLFKVLVDDVLTPHDYRLFIPVALAYLGLTVAGGVVGFVDEYLTAWVGEKFVMSLRVRVFTHLQRVSIGWFERHPLGDVLARLTGDISAIEQLVLTGVNLTLTYAFQAMFFAGTMFVLNWQLTLASFVAAPAFLLLSRTFSRRIQAASRERRRRSGSINAVAEENLANLALVQAYDRADAEAQRFATQNRASFSAQMLAIRLEALFEPFTSLVEAIGVLVVSGAAVYELAQSAITLGGLLAFLAYLGQLYAPVQGFAGLANTLYAASASAERILELLDQEPAVPEPAHPRRLGRAVGAIRFEHVSFIYPGTQRPALHDVDLHLAPGRKIAVVGASGAGKSTLTKLLLRSYDPHHGRITLDGHDLRELDLSDLRRNISVVLQETLVFDGTVAENIRWGKPDATDAQVRAAAQAADAHEFIRRLDHGYHTRVGQRGRLLSGGQRQRLAIARAMIRDAPLLLLDEPTTGLDAASGHRVLAPLRRLMTGRTTIIISHDLLTVADADMIVVLQAGAVHAIGTHHQLLATSPVYAHLYALHHPAVPSMACTPHPVDAAAPTRPFRATGPAAPPRPAAPTTQAPAPRLPPRLSVRPAAPPPPEPAPCVPSQACPRPPARTLHPMPVLLQLAATTPLPASTPALTPALTPQRRHARTPEPRPHTLPHERETADNRSASPHPAAETIPALTASTIPLPRVPPPTTPVPRPPTQSPPGASGPWTRPSDRAAMDTQPMTPPKRLLLSQPPSLGTL